MKLLLLCLSFVLMSCQNKAEEAFVLGDYHRSAKLYNKALDKDPSHLQNRRGYAHSLYMIATDSAWPKVKEEWMFVYAQDSSQEVKDILSQVELELALLYFDQAKVAESLDAISSGLTLDPQNYELHKLNLYLLQWSSPTDFATQAKRLLQFPEWPLEDILNAAEILWQQDKKVGLDFIHQVEKNYPDNDEVLWFVVEWEAALT